MGAFGLEPLFIAYRNLRRRVAHGDTFIALSEAGMVVNGPETSR
jgi:hypothetical protein